MRTRSLLRDHDKAGEDHRRGLNLSKAFVDSVTGDVARVLIGDEEVAVAIPLRQLPPGTRQGMVLQARFTIDDAATAARKKAEKTQGTEKT